MKKKIAILGSTGSIGVQTLEVIKSFPEKFEVEVLTANSNADLLIEQAIAFSPNAVVIADETYYIYVRDALQPRGIKVFSGQKSIESIVEMESIDMVLVALVGFSGLYPTLRAIEYKKNIALANKETLVVGGSLVTKAALRTNVSILPVDSEHSAIFQCLIGEYQNPIEKVILTASGGPFRGRDSAYLKNVTVEEALNHPKWQMGKKISIDSATLMNKGLEVIEAKWLFGIDVDQIDVVVHPQSIIHSLVEFADGSIKAQLGLPDMKLPILYALSYPHRYATQFEKCDFLKNAQLTFEKADKETFPCLDMAYRAIQRGGNIPCVLNAANEVCVEKFLRGSIPFLAIPEFVSTMMESMSYIAEPSLEDLYQTDLETRRRMWEGDQF